METKYIYTIGNCSKITHKEANVWREYCQNYFDNCSEKVKVKIINICDYYSYDEKFHNTDKEIAKFCKREIKKSCCVIVNNHKLDISGGSQREIGLAEAWDIPIFIFNEYLENIYSWDKVWAERYEEGSNSLDEILDHVLEYVVNA